MAWERRVWDKGNKEERNELKDAEPNRGRNYSLGEEKEAEKKAGGDVLE